MADDVLTVEKLEMWLGNHWGISKYLVTNDVAMTVHLDKAEVSTELLEEIVEKFKKDFPLRVYNRTAFELSDLSGVPKVESPYDDGMSTADKVTKAGEAMKQNLTMTKDEWEALDDALVEAANSSMGTVAGGGKRPPDAPPAHHNLKVNVSPDVDTDKMKAMVEDEVKKKAERVEKEMKKSGMVPPGSSGFNKPEEISLGQKIIATMTTGMKTNGTVKGFPDETAGGLTIPGDGRTVKEYWDDEAGYGQIANDEPVIAVDIGGNLNEDYYFPISKLQPQPDDWEGPEPETEDEDWETFECSGCGETYMENKVSTIEGLDGDLYCSVICLNKHE